jgi:tetratricopeptide (TPR) repeat protein
LTWALVDTLQHGDSILNLGVQRMVRLFWREPGRKNGLIFLIFLIFLTSLALLWPDLAVRAAEPPPAHEPLVQLQQRIDALEKALQEQKNTTEILQNKLQLTSATIDSRMYEFGVITTMLANKTTWIGILVAMTGVLITILVGVAGFITYNNAQDKAKKEARSAAKKWFGAKTQDLEREIEQLLFKAEAAQQSIASQADKVLSEAQDASRVMQAAKAEAQSFMQMAISAEQVGLSGLGGQSGDALHSDFVQQANESLKAKPENQFTADEHYIRGASLYHSGNLQAALDSFDAAIRITSDDADNVKYRMARAFTLSTLNQSEEAMATWDALDQQYGQHPLDPVREQVATGLFNKGISLTELGRFEEAIAVYDYLDQRFGQDRAAAVREQVAKGLFNKSYKLGKMGRPEQEIAVLQDLEQRFGSASDPHIREHLLRAHNRLGIKQIGLAKSHWSDLPARRSALSAALVALEKALTLCVPPDKALMRSDQHDRAEVSGHLGYCLFLADEQRAAREPSATCLKLGGQDMLEVLQQMAQQQRQEPEDSQYLKMLDEVWRGL